MARPKNDKELMRRTDENQFSSRKRKVRTFSRTGSL